MIWIHGMCFMAPGTYTPGLALATLAGVVVFGLGIEMVFHRMLCHKSFSSPKWWEYTMAYIGCLNNQGDPIEWVSDHRYHHLHTDTPMDPHSPYEGFWWAHMGWLWDNEVLWPTKGQFANAADLQAQLFYRFMAKTYWLHILAQYFILYRFGGLACVVWLGTVRTVATFHLTFAVNSAAHVWGSQPYMTNDLSKNCSWIALISLGEWHNNHHAFEYSANTGLEWWQFDFSYAVIVAMAKVGLVNNIRLVSDTSKAKLRKSVN
jgi:stearoyl-CoA desaturase (delta-9 desaturase)